MVDDDRLDEIGMSHASQELFARPDIPGGFSDQAGKRPLKVFFVIPFNSL
jgi:hypothetical protein